MAEQTFLWYSARQAMTEHDYTVYITAEGAPVRVTHVTSTEEQKTPYDDMLLVGIVAGQALPVVHLGIVHPEAAGAFSKAYGVPATKNNIAERMLSSEEAAHLASKARIKAHFKQVAAMQSDIDTLKAAVQSLTERMELLVAEPDVVVEKPPHRLLH